MLMSPTHRYGLGLGTNEPVDLYCNLSIPLVVLCAAVTCFSEQQPLLKVTPPLVLPEAVEVSIHECGICVVCHALTVQF